MHPDTAPRRRRADARRNVDALIEAAKTVFAASGVDAPAKEITDLAGVGVGTLYRHFPQRSDLVEAVVESGIDAVADAGPALSAAHEPAEHSPSGSTGSPNCSRPNADSPRRCTRGTRHSRGCPATSCSDLAPPSPRCSTPRWPTARFATTSAPRISCTPSLSCPSPSPGEGPNTTSTSLPCSSTAYAAKPRASLPHIACLDTWTGPHVRERRGRERAARSPAAGGSGRGRGARTEMERGIE